MTANSVVRARIDEQIKNEAAAVLKTMGLTVSDAFRLMMVKIAEEKALPFQPLVPNEETIEAMKAARRGELTTVGPPRKLLASLNEDWLSTPAAFNATKGARNPDGTAGALIPSYWRPSPCWRGTSRCPGDVSITHLAASGAITAIATSCRT
jgi:DNA-damage-inducible protein J